MKLLRKNTPRWVIFIADILICLFSLLLAYSLRFNFHIPKREISTFYMVISFVLITKAICFYIGKSYAGIVIYTSSKDAQRIFTVMTGALLTFFLANIFKYYFINHRYLIPFSIALLDYIISIFMMTGLRLMVKTLYFEIISQSKNKMNVLIFGAGASGMITKRALDRDAGTKYNVLAFIDDNMEKEGNKLEGVSVHHSSRFMKLLSENEVAHVILSVQELNPLRKSEIIETSLAYNVRVLNVPPVNNWINGELSFKQIKKINIEDLLEREPILLDEEEIRNKLDGKTVLITGAAGSIGSGLVRKISDYNPKLMVLLDQAESPLYELEVELEENLHIKNFSIVLGDIKNKPRMEALFEAFRPDVVYHAAAYKHVPLVENNPSEAIEVNVFGTKNIADLAVKYNAAEFIMVSTDKAVNPTNVMGASKRIAEIYVQSLGKKISLPFGEGRGGASTKFITTRFGNVLGSNGSVIPFFKKQIEQGGPVTVTHPEITRYFMLIPEACQLVLEASALGKGGEIFIFDMGKSVKIADLAKKMIKLSRLTLDKDIKIIYTGLRPGEKLYEELLNDQENTLPTHHPQIMIAKVKEYDFAQISKEIDLLLPLLKEQDYKGIVKKMKEILPEFKSNNSVFEELDKLIIEH